MRLLEDGRITTDRWLFLDDEQELPSHPAIVVSLVRWQQQADILRQHQGALAVCLDCAQGESPRSIVEDLHCFAMVVLHIKIFKDGRAFSAARLLRERYRYQKAIRLRGEALPDQWLFYHRCGVNVFEWNDQWREADWREALAEFSHSYQPAADGAASIMSLRQRRASQTANRQDSLAASLKKNISRRKQWQQQKREAP